MNRQQGFTLIEILIALAIFSIIALMTASAMHHILHTRNRIDKHSERLSVLQLALSRIEHDILQTVDRAVRGNDMHMLAAFIGKSDYFELTRDGLINPRSREKRSNLERIAYVCSEDKLIRRNWVSLDNEDRSRYQDEILLNGLSHCHIAYLNHSLQILAEWRENAVQVNQFKEPLPKAIQFDLIVKDWGRMSLLYPIARAFDAK